MNDSLNEKVIRKKIIDLMRAELVPMPRASHIIGKRANVDHIAVYNFSKGETIASEKLSRLSRFVEHQENHAGSDVKRKTSEKYEDLKDLGLFEGFDPSKEQVDPVNNSSLPDINALVQQDLKKRADVGEEKYGTRLRPFNGRDALVDAYQEALDLSVYLRQKIAENQLGSGSGKDPLTFEKYEAIVTSKIRYPENQRNSLYPVLGLCGEAGEVADAFKKAIRNNGGELSEKSREHIIEELGDTLWCIAAIGRHLDVSLTDIAEINVRKVEERYNYTKNHTEGDG